MTISVLLLASLAFQNVPDSRGYRRGEIKERLEGQANFTFNTNKRPVDLELCVADVLSKMASPAAFSDGPDRRVVIASMGKVVAAVELNGSATGTTVIGHIYLKGWDDRMRVRVEGCL